MLSRPCGAITNKNGKICNISVIIGEQYCNAHNYYGLLSEDFIEKIKNKDPSIELCNLCRHFHNDLNVDTGKPYAVCNSCRENEKKKKIVNGCGWCVPYKKEEYDTALDNFQNMNIEIIQHKGRPRIIGFTNFPKCPTQKRKNTDYCTNHEFASEYTEEEKAKVSDCNHCHRIKLLVEGKEFCHSCNDKMIKNNSNRQAITLSNKNSCIAIVGGVSCRNNKKHGDYCASHAFIPERTIENINLGEKMCKYHNVTQVFTEMRSCDDCSILFLYGTSITKNGETSGKCPHCILYLRDYDAQRDRERDYSEYNQRPEIKVKKKQWKEDNPDKVAGYDVNAKARRIENEGIHRYLEKNAQQTKNYREKNPEKQKEINAKKKVNIDTKYKYYKREGENKGREYNLTLEESESYFLDSCYYCGENAVKGEALNGIDRKNNNGNYTLDNCVTACEMCNMMKGDELNDVQFIQVCEHILTYLGIVDGDSYPECFRDYRSTSYNAYKDKAIGTRNIGFNLNNLEFCSIVNNNCYLCGKLTTDTHNNGIDRLDNDIGYCMNNCKSCCGTCNYMKKDYTLDELLIKMCAIYNLHNKQIVVYSMGKELFEKLFNPHEINEYLDVEDSNKERNELMNAVKRFREKKKRELGKEGYKEMRRLEKANERGNVDENGNIIKKREKMSKEAKREKERIRKQKQREKTKDKYGTEESRKEIVKTRVENKAKEKEKNNINNNIKK